MARAIAVLGEGTELWAAAELAGLDEQAGRRCHRRAGEVGDPQARAPARLRPSVGARRGLPRALARRARASACPRGRATSRCPRSGRAGCRAPAGRARRRGPVGSGDVARSRGFGNGARRRRERDPLSRAARSRSRSTSQRALWCCATSDRRRSSMSAATRASTCGWPTRRSPILASARRWRCCLAWALTFTRRPAEARTLTASAAAELGGEHDDLRMGLEALELFTSYFGVGDPSDLARFEPYRGMTEIGSAGAAMIGGRRGARLDSLPGPRRRVRGTGPPGARRARALRVRPGAVLVWGGARPRLRGGARRARHLGQDLRRGLPRRLAVRGVDDQPLGRLHRDALGPPRRCLGAICLGERAGNALGCREPRGPRPGGLHRADSRRAR